MAFNIALRDSFFYQRDGLIDTGLTTKFKITLKEKNTTYTIPYLKLLDGLDSCVISYYETERKQEKKFYAFNKEIYNATLTFNTSGEHIIEIENKVVECCLFARIAINDSDNSRETNYPNGKNETATINDITLISVGSMMKTFCSGCFSGIQVKFEYDNTYYSTFNAPSKIGYEAFSCNNIQEDNYNIRIPYKTAEIAPVAFSNTNKPITLSFVESPSSNIITSSTMSASILSSISLRDNIHTWFGSEPETAATINISSTSLTGNKMMNLKQVDCCSQSFYNKDGYNITSGLFFTDNVGRGGTAKLYNYFNLQIEQTKRQRLLYELKYCTYPNTPGDYVQSIPISIYESYTPTTIKKLMYKDGYNTADEVSYPIIEHVERSFLGTFGFTVNGNTETLHNENNKNNWSKKIAIDGVDYVVTIKIDVDENDNVCYIVSDESGKINLVSTDFENPTTSEATEFIPSFTITPNSILLDSKTPYDNVDNSDYNNDQTFASVSLLLVNNENIIKEDKKLRRFSHTTFSGKGSNLGKKLDTENFYLCFGIFTPYEYMEVEEQQEYLQTFNIDSLSVTADFRSTEYYQHPIPIIRNNKFIEDVKIFINQYDRGSIDNKEKWVKGKFEPQFMSSTSTTISAANERLDYEFGDYDSTIGAYKGCYIKRTIDKALKQQYAFLPLTFPFVTVDNKAACMDDEGNIITWPIKNKTNIKYNGNMVYYPIQVEEYKRKDETTHGAFNKTISVRCFNGYKNSSKGISKEQAIANMNDIHAVSSDGGYQVEPMQYEIEFTCLPSEF